MSLENSKKLYNHYLEVGYSKAAEDLLSKYPEFKDGEKTKRVESGDEERKVNSKGSKGSKK